MLKEISFEEFCTHMDSIKELIEKYNYENEEYSFENILNYISLLANAVGDENGIISDFISILDFGRAGNEIIINGKKIILDDLVDVWIEIEYYYSQ